MLAHGGERPDDLSPWWRVHRLNATVRDAGTRAVSLVRARWRGLQETLLTSAYEHAIEAKRLIESRDEPAARTMLTHYVEENVNAMLKTVDELDESLGGEQ